MKVSQISRQTCWSAVLSPKQTENRQTPDKLRQANELLDGRAQVTATSPDILNEGDFIRVNAQFFSEPFKNNTSGDQNNVGRNECDSASVALLCCIKHSL